MAPEQVEHVIMGHVLQAARGRSRRARRRSRPGSPREVSSETINKVCALASARPGLIDQAVRAGDLDVAVGGGMESMSQAPYLLPTGRFGARMGDMKALDAMIQDGLRNPFSGKQIFEEATEVGEQLEMTRADLDKWALRSHERTIAATDDGRLPEEIVAGDGQGPEGRHRGRGRRGPRRDTTLEALPSSRASPTRRARTPPATRPVSTTAPARSVFASDEWAEREGKEVLGTIIAQAAVADEFEWLARTPANAALKALDAACSPATSTCGRSTRRSPR